MLVLFNIALIILSIIGLVLFIIGLQKTARGFVVFGGTVFLAPIFHLIGWTFLMPMSPVIALAVSLFIKESTD